MQPAEVAKHPEEVLDVLNFHMMGGPPKKKALPSNSQPKSDKAKVGHCRRPRPETKTKTATGTLPRPHLVTRRMARCVTSAAALFTRRR